MSLLLLSRRLRPVLLRLRARHRHRLHHRLQNWRTFSPTTRSYRLYIQLASQTTSPPLRLRAPSLRRRPPPEPAPSTALAPSTTSGPPSAPPLAAPADSSHTPTSPTISEPQPPPPPPWPEGYVFSTDPDRIICRYCCKRHYNYKWYSQCYLCHINESKS